MTTSAKQQLGLAVGILLLAFGLRVGGLDHPTPLASDELLFADRARRMMLQDDFFLTYAYTDKAPTTYIIIGTSLGLVGELDFAVRLPNIYFSLIFLAGLFALTKRLFNGQIALWTVLLASLAPLESRYAVSAFQDTPMLTLAILAMWMARRSKWRWAGLCFGLAVIMKPTGIWFAPLIGVMLGFHHSIPIKERLSKIVQFLALFCLPIVAVYLWDYGRHQHFYELGSSNNNPGRLIRADEVIPRATEWLDILGEFMATRYLTGALLILALGILYIQIRRGLDVIIPLILLNFGVIYLAVHWLVAFNTYDRYMLILAPFFWMLAGYGIVSFMKIMDGYIDSSLQKAWLWVIFAALFIGGSYQPTERAASQNLSAYSSGIPELIGTLESDYTHRIIYDYWLNLELQWYLDPSAGVTVAYFDTPEALAQHLNTERGKRFFIAPSPELAQFWVEILQTQGVAMKLVYQSPEGTYVIYSVLPLRSVLAEFFG